MPILRVISIGALLAMPLIGCHRATAAAAPTSTSASDERGAVGDTVAFHTRILDVTTSRNRVTYDLATPAHVMLLSVIPGKSIDPVVGGISADTSVSLAGRHVVDVAAPAVGRPGVSSPQSAARQDEYDRCVDRLVRGRTRPQPTRVTRDSAGRVIQTVAEKTDPHDERQIEREAERQCASVKSNRGPAPLPPTDRRRYLVLIASDYALTPSEIVERLNATSVTATDVPSTIAAVAEALYLGRAATWSGAYVRW